MEKSVIYDKLKEHLEEKINKINLNDEQETCLIELILYLNSQHELCKEDKILKNNIEELKKMLNN